MKENKLNVKYFHGWKGTWAGEFWKALGKDAPYVLCDGFWSMDFPFPGAKNLGKRYHDKFKKYSMSVGAVYGLCQILCQAIEKAGTLDSAKVRQAVLDNEFETVMGKVKYDRNGVATFVSTAHQWWNGKQMTVMGCCVPTGWGSALNTAKVQPGDSVVVYGLGGVGLNCLRASVLRHANPVIAVDLEGSKEDLAKEFGATHFLDSSKDDPVSIIMELTGGVQAEDGTWMGGVAQTLFLRQLGIRVQSCRPPGLRVWRGKL